MNGNNEVRPVNAGSRDTKGVVVPTTTTQSTRKSNNGRKTTGRKKAVKHDVHAGVPDVYLTEGGKFWPGGDSAYLADLIASSLGVERPKARHKFSQEDAEKRLRERGWLKFRDQRRDSMLAKYGKLEQ